MTCVCPVSAALSIVARVSAQAELAKANAELEKLKVRTPLVVSSNRVHVMWECAWLCFRLFL